MFTLNNYTEAEERFLINLGNDAECKGDKVERLVFGREIGESGTRHLQGCVRFCNVVRIGGAKKILGSDRFHLEVRRGTAQEAEEYCKKDGDYDEFGARPPTKGQRTDLESVKRIIDGGGSLRDVAESSFGTYLRYERALRGYIGMVRGRPRDWVTQVIWFWGSTGTGKSRRAHAEAGALSNGDFCVLADNSTKWCEPYASHRCVIMDDFAGECPIAVLLRMWDRYPMQVAVKGGFVEWSPRLVYVTSNYHPAHFYGGHIQWNALRRRISAIVGFLPDGSLEEEEDGSYF